MTAEAIVKDIVEKVRSEPPTPSASTCGTFRPEIDDFYRRNFGNETAEERRDRIAQVRSDARIVGHAEFCVLLERVTVHLAYPESPTAFALLKEIEGVLRSDEAVLSVSAVVKVDGPQRCRATLTARMRHWLQVVPAFEAAQRVLIAHGIPSH